MIVDLSIKHRLLIQTQTKRIISYLTQFNESIFFSDKFFHQEPQTPLKTK
jgi:hypothetical protein